MKTVIKILSAAILLAVQLTACKSKTAEADPQGGKGTAFFNADNIIGVDQFGRTFGAMTGVRDDRKVGMFFWLWIGQPYASEIYDATEILKMPDGLKLLTDFATHEEQISPNGQAHFWGEPIWGYYNSEDMWVIRKQLQMLTLADVDFIYFDTTNALTYRNVYMNILSIISEMQKEGWRPPKVVFYTHSRSMQTTRTIYEELYKPGWYPSTWYRVDGKPMIIAYTDPADDMAEAASRGDTGYTAEAYPPHIAHFFHFVKPQWPSDPQVYPDGFPWVEWISPQPLHAESDVMNVTVASHPMVPMSFSLTRSGWTNWGRGWNVDTKENVADDVDRGTFFQAQWDHALKADPDVISVGGWNEWIAYKQPWDGEYMLCDAVDKEYSRDIEPMKGGYEDAFYLQLIRNVRAYKGENGVPPVRQKMTMDICGGQSQWDAVEYENRNPDNRKFPRNSHGASEKVTYTTPVPDDLLASVKVAHDDDKIWFRITVDSVFSAPGFRDNWLNVFIGTGEPGLKAWESYDYVIGRNYNGGIVSVGKLNSDFTDEKVGNAVFRIDKNILQIEVPRSLVGLTDGKQFYFKVAAGVDNMSDIMNSYVSGSAMPMGRLSYLYRMSD